MMNRLLLHLLVGVLVRGADIEKLRKARSVFFVEAETASPKEPELALSERLCETLQLSGSPKDDPWLDFGSPAQETHPDINNRGDGNLDDKNFMLLSQKIIDKYLPPNPSQLSSTPTPLSENQSYIDQAEPILNESLELAARYTIRQGFLSLRSTRQTEALEFKVNSPFQLIENLKRALEKRVHEYFNAFDSQKYEETTKIEAGRVQTVRVYNIESKNSQKFSQIWTRTLTPFKNQKFDKIWEALKFLNNLEYYLWAEADFLVASAWLATDSDRPRLLARVQKVSEKLAKIRKGGFSMYPGDKFHRIWALSYKDGMKERMSDKSWVAAGGQIFASVLKGVQQILGADAALKVAMEITDYWPEVQYRVFANQIWLVDLQSYPFSDSTAAVQTEAAKSWDIISELKYHPNSGAGEWFGKIEDRWDEILGLGNTAVSIMNWARALFTPTLLKPDHKKFFAALFQVVASFAVTSSGGLEADLAQHLDAHLDHSFGNHEFYVLMKLAIINSIPNQGYGLSFTATGPGVVDSTCQILVEKDFGNFWDMIRQPLAKFANYFKPQKNTKACEDLFSKLSSKPAKGLTSESFCIVNWDQEGANKPKSGFLIV